MVHVVRCVLPRVFEPLEGQTFVDYALTKYVETGHFIAAFALCGFAGKYVCSPS